MDIDTEIASVRKLIDDTGRAIERALAAGDIRATRELATLHGDLFARLARLTRPPLDDALREAERRFAASAR